MKIVMNDMMLACEVSDMDFYKCYSNQQYQWYQHPTVKRQERQVISSQSGDINKTVIHHQYEFATTQLGLKTLRKGAALAKRGK